MMSLGFYRLLPQPVGFIWRSRNSFVFDNVHLSPHNTLASIYAQLNEYEKFVASQSTLTPAAPNLESNSLTSPRWIPPTVVR